MSPDKESEQPLQVSTRVYLNIHDYETASKPVVVGYLDENEAMKAARDSLGQMSGIAVACQLMLNVPENKDDAIN